MARLDAAAEKRIRDRVAAWSAGDTVPAVAKELGVSDRTIQRYRNAPPTERIELPKPLPAAQPQQTQPAQHERSRPDTRKPLDLEELGGLPQSPRAVLEQVRQKALLEFLTHGSAQHGNLVIACDRQLRALDATDPDTESDTVPTGDAQPAGLDDYRNALAGACVVMTPAGPKLAAGYNPRLGAELVRTTATLAKLTGVDEPDPMAELTDEELLARMEALGLRRV